MDWKEYEITPDTDLFGSIQRRLRLRRAFRWGGAITVAAVATVALAIALAPAKETPQSQLALTLPSEVDNPLLQADQQAESPVMQSEPAPKPTQNHPASTPDDTTRQQPLPDIQVAPIADPSTNLSPLTSHLSPSSASLPHPSHIPPTSLPHPSHLSPLTSPDTLPALNNQQPPQTSPAKVGGIEPPAYHEDNILWAPNIIVPNGDVDENRVFKVVPTSDVNDFRLQIYNRGGHLVFRTDDANTPWDATHDGTPVPQGAYVWVATFRGTDGTPHRESGTITVVW